MSDKAKIKIEIEYNDQWFWDETEVVPNLLTDGAMDLLGGLNLEVHEDDNNEAKVAIEIKYNGQWFEDEEKVVPELIEDCVMDIMCYLEVAVQEEEEKRMEVKKLLKE